VTRSLGRRRSLERPSGSVPPRRERDPRPDPQLGVPTDRRGRPGPARPEALGATGARRHRGACGHPGRRALGRSRRSPRRDRPPRARARLPARRRRRVHRLGRAHERGHARGRGGAGRRVRPRPLARLVGRRRGAQARAPLEAAMARHRPRHRVRPPPGLGGQAPAVAHPRRRAPDGAQRRPRDHLLGLYARARRRRVRNRARRRDRDPERDRPDRPTAGLRPPAAARAVRGAGREARPAGRAAGLREGLSPRAGGDAAADRAARRRAPPAPAPAPPRPSSRRRRASWG
jgi:hypothetical protein